MNRLRFLKSILIGGASALILAAPAAAKVFDIPGGDLATALADYIKQSNMELIYADNVVRGHRSHGARGDFTETAALTQILRGTGFTAQSVSSTAIGIVPATGEPKPRAESIRVAAAEEPTPAKAGVETVVVTAQKKSENIQNVPIAVTALSQEQLTERQIAGGPDLVKEVPNLTFSKTNFTGYNIEIRGIGTQAISVTTDPAVAVALNNIPFIRNHFFEQEFFDVQDVEVLRGPQGTLYGRNATAGVVNLKSALPTDQYEAMASADIGNFSNRRLEGMLNIPIVGDKLDLRLAGEWTRRDGYTFNAETDQSVDGRDLWSGRVSLRVHPIEKLTANFVWEHFSEDDDRLRSGKQLCTKSNAPSEVDGPAGSISPSGESAAWLSQGCAPGPLYGPTAFQTPNVGALPFIAEWEYVASVHFIAPGLDPYGSVVQSQNLRTISSELDPKYRAKNDTFEINADYAITNALTLTSQTGYNKDSLYSTEDYNRFSSIPNVFQDVETFFGSVFPQMIGQDGQFCDPQLGCSTRLIGEDVSQEHAWQFSQELRLASNFSGPFNFSVGGNFLHYQTVEDYYVFYNAITLFSESTNMNFNHYGFHPDAPHVAFDPVAANDCNPLPAPIPPADANLFGCEWIDPNPLNRIDGQGHNYFRSQNPYRLNSYAGFGEVYYQVTPEVKLTGGLRWTDDRKYFVEIPSWAAQQYKGFSVAGTIAQEWKEWTGRFVADWTPKLDFTDQSLFYGSYSRGYKGGGANPPGVVPLCPGGICLASPSDTTHPLTFKPEFVDAFELGTKNTLLDDAMTLNADIFYYKYQGYQISQIVDRTSVNLNFNADVKGAEVETTWEPVPGLRFNLAGGYENTRLANGSQAIDLMDRTAGHAGWLVVKPFITATSNCIVPTDAINEILARYPAFLTFDCLTYAHPGFDPATLSPYVPFPFGDAYAGFDSSMAPNNGEGFAKNLSGNQLPNAPPFTLSGGAQYSLPLSSDWVGTLRGDFYWQGNSFARVFNDRPYDRIHGYTNVNLALIFDNQDGWEVMAYMKNVFDTTAITGAFLNSDDTGLTTNVFTTDPRLFGVRITKNF